MLRRILNSLLPMWDWREDILPMEITKNALKNAELALPLAPDPLNKSTVENGIKKLERRERILIKRGKATQYGQKMPEMLASVSPKARRNICCGSATTITIKKSTFFYRHLRPPA